MTDRDGEVLRHAHRLPKAFVPRGHADALIEIEIESLIGITAHETQRKLSAFENKG